MNWSQMILSFTRKKQSTVIIGGEKVPIKPLSLKAALEFILLLSPHLSLIERHWGEFQRALSGSGKRPQILQAIFSALREEMQKTPGDMIKALGILLDRDPEWLAQNITAREFVEALPVLDEVNDFPAMWSAVAAYGLSVRYEK
jgi:hypothetical protein